METEILNKLIATELQIKPHQVNQVISLLEEGNTVPFIARYRKEMTGSLDEVQIKGIEDRHHYIQQLEQRKEEVIRLIAEQEKLTPELEASIRKA
ncbi:MAG: Tex-like N-terminal domain-containing protein, partial [Kurthia sp.]